MGESLWALGPCRSSCSVEMALCCYKFLRCQFTGKLCVFFGIPGIHFLDSALSSKSAFDSARSKACPVLHFACAAPDWQYRVSLLDPAACDINLIPLMALGVARPGLSLAWLSRHWLSTIDTAASCVSSVAQWLLHDMAPTGPWKRLSHGLRLVLSLQVADSAALTLSTWAWAWISSSLMAQHVPGNVPRTQECLEATSELAPWP